MDDEISDLRAGILAELPDVIDRWLSGLRPIVELLTCAAIDRGMSDDDFRGLLKSVTEKPVAMVEAMDINALASHLDGAMGSAGAMGKVTKRRDCERRIANIKKR